VTRSDIYAYIEVESTHSFSGVSLIAFEFAGFSPRLGAFYHRILLLKKKKERKKEKEKENF
jgi:hypothetical protein